MNICFSTLGCTDRSLADILDLAVKYGVIHRNKANRKKSRLAALLKG